ncbi:hypothetical protein HIM_06496 [Hirsutella minnesotensis 3608]|uniref:DNA2/NAM7 helicase-like C-terminal domain-containing protein n=1 Tax=Hirsutella minnesotensis 3608 TaxID=1043627 RepID=A0A0F7ZZD8_9HYPO|nr:hypothetical protein HIM_06496 [Hirsutella minnesotensis 3608]
MASNEASEDSTSPKTAPSSNDGPASKPTVKKTGRVAWVVPSHQLAADAEKRLTAEFSGKKNLTRVYAYELEWANMFVAENLAPQLPEDFESADEGTQDILRLLHRVQLEDYNMSPSVNPLSLSEKAKAMVLSDPVRWRLVKDAQIQFDIFGRLDEVYFILKKVVHKALQAVVDDTDMIIATPVALAQFADHFKWSPNLIMVDEAGRMTEASALIPLSKYPTAYCLFMGDIEPANPSGEAEDLEGPGGNQRGRSIMDLVASTGAVSTEMTKNYRCHGSVGNFVRDRFYKGKMEIVNEHSGMSRSIGEFFSDLSIRPGNEDIRGQLVIIEAKGSKQRAADKSYINDANVNVALQLIRQLFQTCKFPNVDDKIKSQAEKDVRVRRGSILIVVAYSAQKAEYEHRIAQLSVAEYPPGHLSVRTIDDSPGCEAEIVIVDFVRTGESPGVMGEGRELALALSRARLATFVLASSSAVPSAGPLAALWEYCRSNNAVISLGTDDNTWGDFCSRCDTAGHARNECSAVIRCTACTKTGVEANHLGRNCPRAIPASAFLDEAIPPVDNVGRSLFVSTGKVSQE